MASHHITHSTQEIYRETARKTDDDQANYKIKQPRDVIKMFDVNIYCYSIISRCNIY